MLLSDLLHPSAFPPPVGMNPGTPISAPWSFGTWLATSYVKAFLPIPILAGLLPIVWWFFRDTWRELDTEAHRYRGSVIAAGEYDLRPIAMFVIAAVSLTLQEYYGGRGTYDELVRPWLVRRETVFHSTHVNLAKYDELYGYAWWAFCRVVGYVLIPFPAYKLLFPKDSLLDMGLRVRGFFQHFWIYGVCLAAVIPAMWLVSQQPDFGTYYPFYKQSSRSYADWMLWESMYFAQFFALELFFRGLWLGALRHSLGSGAIFSMAVPYCMIHYGKPYLEANGAIVAGIVLGSLSMRTRSIYAGFLVHITVALSMDWLALSHRNALPHILWGPG